MSVSEIITRKFYRSVVGRFLPLHITELAVVVNSTEIIPTLNRLLLREKPSLFSNIDRGN